jgi:hypothetical protein
LPKTYKNSFSLVLRKLQVTVDKHTQSEVYQQLIQLVAKSLEHNYKMAAPSEITLKNFNGKFLIVRYQVII